MTVCTQLSSEVSLFNTNLYLMLTSVKVVIRDYHELYYFRNKILKKMCSTIKYKGNMKSSIYHDENKNPLISVQGLSIFGEY